MSEKKRIGIIARFRALREKWREKVEVTIEAKDAGLRLVAALAAALADGRLSGAEVLMLDNAWGEFRDLLIRAVNGKASDGEAARVFTHEEIARFLFDTWAFSQHGPESEEGARLRWEGSKLVRSAWIAVAYRAEECFADNAQSHTAKG